MSNSSRMLTAFRYVLFSELMRNAVAMGIMNAQCAVMIYTSLSANPNPRCMIMSYMNHAVRSHMNLLRLA